MLVIKNKLHNMREKHIKQINVTDGQTDRQTDDILWHNHALRSIAR